MKHFLKQHVGSQTHQKKLRGENGANPPSGGGQADGDGLVDCKGLAVSSPHSARNLYKYKAEFELWASMANFAEQGNVKHQYTRDANSNCWTVRAGDCLEKTVPAKCPCCQPICSKCFALGDSHSIVRSCQRFAIKYYAAQVLSMRLFAGKFAVEQTMEEIQEKEVYKTNKGKLQEILKASNRALQSVVSTSWLCDSKPSEPVQKFLDTVVRPALNCNLATVSDRLSDCIAQFQAAIRSGECQDKELVNLKVASACLKGDFENHPLLLGLCLQSHRMLQKMEKGQDTMKGRRSAHTELEADLIRDSGLQLAIATGNNRLAVEFGLSTLAGRITLEDLTAHNLPNPALALCFPDTLRENFKIADHRYVRRHGAPKRPSASYVYCLLWNCSMQFHAFL